MSGWIKGQKMSAHEWSTALIHHHPQPLLTAPSLLTSTHPSQHPREPSRHPPAVMFAASSCYVRSLQLLSWRLFLTFHLTPRQPPPHPHPHPSLPLLHNPSYNLISPPYRRALLGDLFAETVESESRQQNSQRRKLIVSALTSSSLGTSHVKSGSAGRAALPKWP